MLQANVAWLRSNNSLVQKYQQGNAHLAQAVVPLWS